MSLRFRKNCNTELVNFEVEVLKSQMKRLDDVATLYSGQARITSVSISFLVLVQAVACQRLSTVKRELDLINQTRPLLDHEVAYLRMVREAANSW